MKSSLPEGLPVAGMAVRHDAGDTQRDAPVAMGTGQAGTSYPEYR